MPDSSPPRPPRRDGVLPPVGARTPGLDELGGDDDGGSDDRGAAWADDRRDEPNYLVRRALAVGAGIAAIGGGVFGVSLLLGGDDGGGANAGANAEWNSIVVLTAEEVRLVDPSNGDVLDTYDAPGDLLDAQSATAGDVLVTMSDAGRIVMTDLGDGTTTSGRAGLDETLRMSAANPAIGIVGADAGGDITIVDTVGRSVVSAEAVAGLDDPLIFANTVVVNPSGTHAAMADARTFQSIVVDIATEMSAALAGQVVAIGDERVVTAQRAGANTELEFYDLQGERLGSVDVPTPAASMLTDDGEMLVVDAAGAIRLAKADGDLDDVGALTDPDDETATFEVEGGVAVAGNSRLLVATARSVHVLDDDGAQIGVAPGDIVGTPDLASRCVAIGSPRSTGSSAVVDLDDGSIIAEIGGGIPTTTSVDGCTIAVIGADGPQLIIDGEIRSVDANSIIAVAPDGSAYIELDGRDSELVSISGDDRVEIADEPSVIRFAQR